MRKKLATFGIETSAFFYPLRLMRAFIDFTSTEIPNSQIISPSDMFKDVDSRGLRVLENLRDGKLFTMVNVIDSPAGLPLVNSAPPC